MDNVTTINETHSGTETLRDFRTKEIVKAVVSWDTQIMTGCCGTTEYYDAENPVGVGWWDAQGPLALAWECGTCGLRRSPAVTIKIERW